MNDEDRTVKLSGHGVVKALRENYGVQATTCVGPNPANPNDNTAAVAVQAADTTGDEYREFLAEQGFERVESIGRGLFAYERTEADT